MIAAVRKGGTDALTSICIYKDLQPYTDPPPPPPPTESVYGLYVKQEGTFRAVALHAVFITSSETNVKGVAFTWLENFPLL